MRLLSGIEQMFVSLEELFSAVGYIKPVSQSAPENLSLTKTQRLVSYVGDRLQRAAGNRHYVTTRVAWFIVASGTSQ